MQEILSDYGSVQSCPIQWLCDLPVKMFILSESHPVQGEDKNSQRDISQFPVKICIPGESSSSGLLPKRLRNHTLVSQMNGDNENEITYSVPWQSNIRIVAIE